MTKVSSGSHGSVMFLCSTATDTGESRTKIMTMKKGKIGCLVIATALLATGITGCATEKQEQAKLTANARIAKAEAEKIALAKVPGGIIKEGEIEKEKGKVIWSFDIITPDTKDITEVAVDAMTGEVVAVDKETPKEKKGKKEKGEDEEKEEK
jgi:uncharacterized membrane protein YkoI